MVGDQRQHVAMRHAPSSLQGRRHSDVCPKPTVHCGDALVDKAASEIGNLVALLSHSSLLLTCGVAEESYTHVAVSSKSMWGLQAVTIPYPEDFGDADAKDAIDLTLKELAAQCFTANEIKTWRVIFASLGS